jgi:hypothetical protein
MFVFKSIDIQMKGQSKNLSISSQVHVGRCLHGKYTLTACLLIHANFHENFENVFDSKIL